MLKQQYLIQLLSGIAIHLNEIIVLTQIGDKVEIELEEFWV